MNRLVTEVRLIKETAGPAGALMLASVILALICSVARILPGL